VNRIFFILYRFNFFSNALFFIFKGAKIAIYFIFTLISQNIFLGLIFSGYSFKGFNDGK